MVKYEKIKELLETTSTDVKKTAAGNKTAGIRVRKVLQEIIAEAKNFRKEISALSNNK
jgi:spore coat protein CotF